MHVPPTNSFITSKMSFIGSGGSFTFNQRQTDIEFHLGVHPPAQRRLFHHCIGHGMAFMYTEVNILGVWLLSPTAGFVNIHYRGPSTVPALAPPGIPLPPVVLFAAGVVGPLFPAGFLIPFCDRIFVSHPLPAPPPPIFRFVPHTRANPNADMIPDPTRPPIPFTELEYGGHIQNWRKRH